MADSDERIAKCLERLKSNDSEVKIDALNKLQAEFAAGVQPTEIEEVIAALKTTLRIPNQHVSTASLSAISALFPVIVTHRESEDHGHPSSHDATVFRHALLAFLSAGGILDRLGDNRERARDCARDALVSAGNTALKFNPNPTSASASAGPGMKHSQATKGPEPPLAMFERFLRELGFSSKVTRVREQSILTLLQLRRTNQRFPLRPFLTHLVDVLEDSDGGVRDCARNAVIEMFTASTVTDSARADLKKEMTKKGVRKGIVDNILNQLLAAPTQTIETSAEDPSHPPALSTTGSHPGLPTQKSSATLASSVAGPSRTQSFASTAEVQDGKTEEVVTVYVASVRDLEHEFATMQPPFEGKETEHNWQLRERAIQRVRGMLKGDVHIRYLEAFMECLKSGFMTNSLKTLASLRTTVSTNTCALYAELVLALRHAFEPFVELTLTALFKMSSLTKKIVANQSQATVREILLHGHCHPRIVMPLLWNGIQDKNVSARQYTVGHIRTVLENTAVRGKSVIESSGGLELLEKSIKKALGDANAGIRDSARSLFWIFDGIWKDRADAIANTLDPTARKQLDKVAPTGQASQNGTVPIAEAKKSSVAAAIAASRAKAKQIAAAPPTLRHAATSHASSMASHARRPASPGSPSGRTPVASGTTAKRASGAFSRSSTAPALTTGPIAKSPSQSASISTASASPPPSPTQYASQKLNNSVRIASAVPLPSSPPNTYRSPPKGTVPLKSSLSARSMSPPSTSTNRVKRASGVFASPKGTTLTHMPATNDTLTLSPHPSDDESLMRVRAPNSDAGSSESLPMASFSDAVTSTPPGRTLEAASLTRSTNPLKVPGPVIEDALRARAEQAESAAERLLEELVEPDDTVQNLHIPPSLMPSASTAKPPLKASTSTKSANGNATKKSPPPATPANKRSVLLRQAAAYQDSPPYKRGSSSIVDRLKDRRNESSWWLKRVSLLQETDSQSGSDPSTQLAACIDFLENGTAGVAELNQLIFLCRKNPAMETEGDEGLTDDIWKGGLVFNKLSSALFQYLTCDKPEDILERGLIVIWEMVEHQQSYLEGRESELLALLFHLRYCNLQTISEASNTIRDALTDRIDPIYGLSTMHTSLKRFLAEPIPTDGNAETRALSHAFGLLAIGKFILRLPTEILEEELPRLQLTLSQSLNDTQLLVRESAAAAIIAAQLVLRDETYLFTMLASLSDEKKNLLTYLFDKHGARGTVEGVSKDSGSQGGLDRLEKEMKRLDSKTSTPIRKL